MSPEAASLGASVTSSSGTDVASAIQQMNANMVALLGGRLDMQANVDLNAGLRGRDVFEGLRVEAEGQAARQSRGQ
jgi:phage portal protein BeeE